MQVAINQSLGRGKAKASLKSSYINALRYLGCSPCIVTPFEENNSLYRKLAQSSGLILIGGPDLPEEFYGGRCHPTINPQEVRKVETDFRLIRLAEELRKPVLGICAGMQTLGVYFGGRLFQHIPEAGTDIVHQSPKGRHLINMTPWMKNVFGHSRVSVNSRHHQCVENAGPDIIIEAQAPDGIVEAIRHRKLPILGVQWHPEDLVTEAPFRKLFHSFLNGYR